MRKLIDSALAADARMTARASTPETGKGYFFRPSVLADVPGDLVQHEIFGPIAPVLTWRDEDELLDRVNDTEMGLAVYVYAGDLQHALRLGEALDAGMVGINRGLVSDAAAPFGGIKHSGIGREGTHESGQCLDPARATDVRAVCGAQ